METNSATVSSHKRTDLDKFLAAQAKQDQLRFITCGSVDDGKSTLIGRLLWEGQQLFDDQLAALKTDSEKFGTQGENIDFALLVDGLAAEREQGITIDVAYRYFATKRRKFIVADTPGHEQYTRNMVTAASTAEVAVLLVDARKGILTQTKRHAFLASLLGVRHVVLAVNKMDAVDFDAAIFGDIQSVFDLFAATIGFAQVVAIPVSALKGDNITSCSAKTPWYDGPTLMSYLETVKIAASTARGLVFPVQWINRPNADFRGISGTIAEGQLTVGDEIRVTGSGQTATIAELVGMGANQTSALAGDAVTICLDKQIDVSRGDILAPAQTPLEMTDQFEATVVWMSNDVGLIGRNYDIKLATQWASASVTNIKYRIDVNTLSHDASTSLALNDVSVCNLALSRPVVFDTYKQSKVLGGFILVDRFTQSTVAAGMIRHTLRRAQNVHRQELSITRQDRESLNGHRGQVIWFTGLSGSGKSTIANALEIELISQGLRTYILDGDNIRQGLNKDLGFSDADRVENIRRVAEVARLMMDAGLIVLTAFISPFQQERQLARSLIGNENFFEVYVSTSLAICEQRDPKGLYKKARNGQLPNLTGINSDYEVPRKPELILETAKRSVAETVQELLSVLKIQLDAVMGRRQLVEKSADADLLREMIDFAAEKRMALEVGAATGAGCGEKTALRLAQRNGYRDRDWETRAGTVELVRKRGGRERALVGARAPMLVPMAASDRLSLDFVLDAFNDGGRLRVLTVVDDCTRECLALVADTSLSGLIVARELDRIIQERGKPRMIISDNGSAYTSNTVLQSADRLTNSRNQGAASLGF